jgi:hypothetical protein
MGSSLKWRTHHKKKTRVARAYRSLVRVKNYPAHVAIKTENKFALLVLKARSDMYRHVKIQTSADSHAHLNKFARNSHSARRKEAQGRQQSSCAR